jgi:hypothetical protein
MINRASMFPFALIIGQIGDHCNDKNFGARSLHYIFLRRPDYNVLKLRCYFIALHETWVVENVLH